jgi:nitrate/nitrite-specific signal transduction histidine kinase
MAHTWSEGIADLIVALLVTIGVVAVSNAVFRVIGRQERHLIRQYAELEDRYASERQLRSQLEALHQAALTIASAGSAPEILQRLVDLARDLIGARYAALGVLGPHGGIAHFFTSGIDEALRSRLGDPPQGHGLLNVTLTEGTSLRLADLTEDPRAAGFPTGHPPMRSLLAVPVAHAGHVAGNLYLTERIGADEFSAEDERLLTLLASHAAVVIRQSRLTDQVRMLAVAAERERIRKDLHDGAIQAIYAVNLGLEQAQEDVEADPQAARAGIDEAIERLGRVMEAIRSYILDIGEAIQPDSVPEGLAALLAEARATALLETDLRIDGEAAAALTAGQRERLLQIAREVITNVTQHARASRLGVALSSARDGIRLRIAHNGAGTYAEDGPAGGGTAGIGERAAALGGTLSIERAQGGGAVIEVHLPPRAGQQEGAYA